MRTLPRLRDRPSEPICLVSIAHLVMQLASQETHTSSSPPSGTTLFSIRRSSPLSPSHSPTTSPAIVPFRPPSFLRGSPPQLTQAASP